MRRVPALLLRLAGEYECARCAAARTGARVTADCGATLIVCPASILSQWHAEIRRHTQPGEVPWASPHAALCGLKTWHSPSPHDLAICVQWPVSSMLQSHVHHCRRAHGNGLLSERLACRYSNRMAVVMLIPFLNERARRRPACGGVRGPGGARRRPRRRAAGGRRSRRPRCSGCGPPASASCCL